MKIRVGSRDSKLAVIQSQIVIDAIKNVHPELELELITMKTTGDKILDRTLDKVGGKGLFVKELDRALLNREVDITVHSFKDMPMEVDPRLPIVAVSQREDPRDVLVLPAGVTQLEGSAPIGCSSARRRLQLQRLFPGRKIAPVRGNVLTRLEKLDRGEYSALVLACAGMRRLSLEDRISRFFSMEEILPAACQGVLAVQAHQELDPWFLREFHDEKTRGITAAERSFVRTLNGGCSSPVAAYAQIVGDTITLTGLYAREDGGDARLAAISGPAVEGERLGRELALRMKVEKEGEPIEL